MHSPDVREIEEVAQQTFRGLREMDVQSATGLCDYVACSPYAGKTRKDEAAITWGITEVLRKRWHIEQCEHAYPVGGGRCDRIVQLSDGSRLWLEIKLAWRTWFYEVVKHNAPFMYNGYFGGEHHSHSVAHDLAKMERIGRDHARYLALLVVGFDGRDGKMADDMTALADREGLMKRGWHLLSESWPTRQSDECWNRCWLAWREAK
jgi:hypothetical protein